MKKHFFITLAVLAAIGVVVFFKDKPEITHAQEVAIHPRLLFTAADIPTIKQKLTDGQDDDDSVWTYTLQLADSLATQGNVVTLVGQNYGLNNLPILAAAYQFTDGSNPNHSAYATKCQTIASYIAASYAPATQDQANPVFDQAMRLYVLSLGLDTCFDTASQVARDAIITEIEGYITSAVANANQPWTSDWRFWGYPPYTQNKGLMAAGTIGMASIVLRGESANTQLLDDGLAFSDWMIGQHQLYELGDTAGADSEGLLYGVWSYRFLIPYIEARKAYDGTDYSQSPAIQNAINWLAYEVFPDTAGTVNNLNDTLSSTSPLALHSTIMSWAQKRYDSTVAKWLWRKSIYGYNYGSSRDLLGDLIWIKNIPATQPGSVLPKSQLFSHRGLYYYHSGWPEAKAVPDSTTYSNDSVFSLYAGKYWGGHAQEDQGQFTLFSRRERFIVDTGYSTQAKESEGHNLVLIDDAGEHNAGSSGGTDASFDSVMINPWTDFLHANLKPAYDTYSPYNENGEPWSGTDWTAWHTGANPVLNADRYVQVVKKSSVGEYFVVIDDITKDGASHTYDLLLHSRLQNTITTSANPARITGATTGSILDAYFVHPIPANITFSQSTFATNNTDGDTKRLKARTTATNPDFFVIYLPHTADGSETAATYSTLTPTDGYGALISWANGVSDYLLYNKQQTTTSSNNIESNGLLSLTRFDGANLTQFSLAEGSSLSVNAVPVITVTGGTANVASDGDTISVSDPDLGYVIAGTGITSVIDNDGNPVAFTEVDGNVYINVVAPVDATAPSSITDLNAS